MLRDGQVMATLKPAETTRAALIRLMVGRELRASGRAEGPARALRVTPFGRHLYAVGGNREVARRMGLPVDRVSVLAYALSGLAAAGAGLLYASRVGLGDPVIGEGLELDAITAVVLGGTSLFGGRGGVVGTMAGVLILSFVGNIMTLAQVSSWYQQLIKGLIIIIAVAVYRQRR